MTLIATPISHLFEDLSVGQRIAAASDCLECRERSVANTTPGQRLFHFDIDLTHPWDDALKANFKTIFQVKRELELVTCQIAVNCTAPVLEGRLYQPGGRTMGADEMRDNACVNVDWLRQTLPNGVRLGIENNNYYPTPAYEIVTEGAFISRIVNDTGIEFLFDIAHAMVSAHNLGITFDDYVDTLPMSKAAQIHICAPSIPNVAAEIAFDTHQSPDDNMIALCVDFIGRFGIDYATIEYYQDPDLLIVALSHLRRSLAVAGLSGSSVTP